MRPRGCRDCGGPSGKMAAVRPGEAGGAIRSSGLCGRAVTMRGCLGWLRSSSDCHLVSPEPGGLSPLVRISAPELESGRGVGVMSSGWAWGHFGYPGCPEARLLNSSDIPELHTERHPSPPVYDHFTSSVTRGSPVDYPEYTIVAYELHNHISLKLTCMAYLWLILSTPMPYPLVTPSTPLTHLFLIFRCTLGTPD